jgi:hypothetical protein
MIYPLVQRLAVKLIGITVGVAFSAVANAVGVTAITTIDQPKASLDTVLSLAHRSAIAATAISPDGSLLATADDNSLAIWDIASQTQLNFCSLRYPGPSSLKFVKSSAAVLVAGDSGYELISVRGGQSLFAFDRIWPVEARMRDTSSRQALCFDMAGESGTMAVAGIVRGNYEMQWSDGSTNSGWQVPLRYRPLECVLSTTGSYLAVSYVNGAVDVWRRKDGCLVHRTPAGDKASLVKFGSSEKWMAVWELPGEHYTLPAYRDLYQYGDSTNRAKISVYRLPDPGKLLHSGPPGTNSHSTVVSPELQSVGAFSGQFASEFDFSEGDEAVLAVERGALRRLNWENPDKSLSSSLSDEATTGCASGSHGLHAVGQWAGESYNGTPFVALFQDQTLRQQSTLGTYYYFPIQVSLDEATGDFFAVNLNFISRIDLRRGEVQLVQNQGFPGLSRLRDAAYLYTRNYEYVFCGNITNRGESARTLTVVPNTPKQDFVPICLSQKSPRIFAELAGNLYATPLTGGVPQKVLSTEMARPGSNNVPRVICLDSSENFLLRLLHSKTVELWEISPARLVFQTNLASTVEAECIADSSGTGAWYLAGYWGLLEIRVPGQAEDSPVVVKKFDEPLKAMSISPDKKLLFLQGYHAGYLFNVVTGKTIAELPTDPEGRGCFSLKSDIFAAPIPGGAIGFWKVATGAEFARLLIADQDNYAFVLPNGYYKSTRGCLQRISFRTGLLSCPFESFDIAFNRPDYVLQGLGSDDISLIADFQNMVEARQTNTDAFQWVQATHKSVSVLSLENSVPLTTETNEIDLKVRANDGFKKLRISVNNVPLSGNQDVLLPAQSSGPATCEFKVKLSAGENHVVIGGISGKSSVFFPGVREIFFAGSAAQPRLFFVGLAVTNYIDRSLPKLDYPLHDVAILRGLFESLFSSHESMVFTNDQVTGAALTKAAEFLRKTTEDDLVVVSLQGHGFLDLDQNYYFGGPAVDPKNPRNGGISLTQLMSLWNDVRARKRLVLMDTCSSGQIDTLSNQYSGWDSDHSNYFANLPLMPSFGPRHPRGPVETPLLERNWSTRMDETFTDVRMETGSTFIAASGGDESASESTAWNGGAFTFSVIEGLSDFYADLNGDLRISVQELSDFVAGRVVALTGGQQRPTFARENLRFDFPILKAMYPRFVSRATNDDKFEASFFRSLAFSKNRRLVAFATMNRFRICDVSREKSLAEYYQEPERSAFPFDYGTLEFSGNGQRLMGVPIDNARIDIFDTHRSSGRVKPQLTIPWKGQIPSLSCEGDWICAAAGIQSSEVLARRVAASAASGSHTLPNGAQVIFVKANFPADSFKIVASSGETFDFDPAQDKFQSRAALHGFEASQGIIRDINTSPGGEFLGVRFTPPFQRQKIGVWDLKTGNRVYAQDNTTDAFCFLTSDGPLVIDENFTNGASEYVTVHVVSLKDGTEQQFPKYSQDRLNVSPDCRELYVSNEGRMVGFPHPPFQSGYTQNFGARELSLTNGRIRWLGVPYGTGIFGLGVGSRPLLFLVDGAILGWDSSP